MQDISAAFLLAIQLLVGGDADLYEIVGLSLRVSITAVFLASVIGFSLGAFVAISRFRGRTAIKITLNALLGLPPVVVGLFVYILISNAGPFGWMRLLYTPTAMIIAQVLLITPIIAALSTQIIEDLHAEYSEQFQSFSMGKRAAMQALLWDGRYSLMTVALAGLGRALSEVGAIIIVGGNIDHLTRVMTTAIALETSKGDLSLALALGLILIVLSLLINSAVMGLRLTAKSYAYA